MNTAIPLVLLLLLPCRALAAEDDVATDDTTDATLDSSSTTEASASNEALEIVPVPTPAAPEPRPLVIDTPRWSGHERGPWIHAWAPEPKMAELGTFFGMLRVGAEHELFEPQPDAPDQGFERLSPVSSSFGLRAGYYPSRFIGFEAEGGFSPTQTESSSRALLWSTRGSMVAQLGQWSITPFGLVGGGVMGVRSGSLGNDVDPSLVVGGGLKAYPGARTQIRVDVRDVISNRRGVNDELRNHGLEVLVGVSLTLGRTPGGPDRDGDGVPDSRDRCRSESGAGASGCPLPDADSDGTPDRDDRCPHEFGIGDDGCSLRDSDGDGLLDPDDSCVDEPGVAPDGCPVRDEDRDGDGFEDGLDMCVEEPGVGPFGCPALDSDGDGRPDASDECVDVPGDGPSGCPIHDDDLDGVPDADDGCRNLAETFNGFEDTDGCPDTIPTELQRLDGTLEGVKFFFGKTYVLPRSYDVIDDVAAVLRKYPEVRIEIIGHTDNAGPADYNNMISKMRADAIRKYLVRRGVSAERIQTRGAGDAEPVADNRTKLGRQTNRRIELDLQFAPVEPGGRD